jgi:hypothetical protein
MTTQTALRLIQSKAAMMQALTPNLNRAALVSNEMTQLKDRAS